MDALSESDALMTLQGEGEEVRVRPVAQLISRRADAVFCRRTAGFRSRHSMPSKSPSARRCSTCRLPSLAASKFCASRNCGRRSSCEGRTRKAWTRSEAKRVCGGRRSGRSWRSACRGWASSSQKVRINAQTGGVCAWFADLLLPPIQTRTLSFSISPHSRLSPKPHNRS